MFGHPKLVLAPLSAEAQKLYDAIYAKGYRPHEEGTPADLRDAAHEAHHALFCNVRGPWTRERIHKAIVRRANKLNAELIGMELMARAVEWIVCERFSIEYDVARWGEVMWWETIKNMRIQLPDPPWVKDAITRRKREETTKRLADAVLALAAPVSFKLHDNY